MQAEIFSSLCHVKPLLKTTQQIVSLIFRQYIDFLLDDLTGIVALTSFS